MFIGTFEPKIDSKGRFALPAKYRAQLEAGLVITRGQEHCLYLFTTEEFQKLYSRLREAPLTSKQARDFLRVLLSGASDETPDKQGRVNIPAPLRKYAGLDKQLVITGIGARAEIWDKEKWEAYMSEQEENFASQAEEIVPGMF